MIIFSVCLCSANTIVSALYSLISFVSILSVMYASTPSGSLNIVPDFFCIISTSGVFSVVLIRSASCPLSFFVTTILSTVLLPSACDAPGPGSTAIVVLSVFIRNPPAFLNPTISGLPVPMNWSFGFMPYTVKRPCIN